MAVTERTPSRSLTQTRDGLIQCARDFDVDADSEVDALAELLADAAYQVTIGKVYTNAKGVTPNAQVRCVGLSVETRVPAAGTHSGLYHVTAEYSTPDGQLPQVDGDAVWTSERSLQEVPADIDRNGDDVVNSAGEPLTDLKTLLPNEIAVATWIVSGTTYANALTFARTYQGHVNSALWYGAPARCLLCHSIGVTLMQNGVNPLIKYQAKFEYKPSVTIGLDTVPGWTERTWDRGLNTRDGAGALHAITRLVNGVAKEVTEPVYLDGAGGELDHGDDPVLLQFEILPEIAFAGIGI